MQVSEDRTLLRREMSPRKMCMSGGPLSHRLHLFQRETGEFFDGDLRRIETDAGMTLGMTEGKHLETRTLSGCPPKSSTLTNRREAGDFFEKDRCQVEIAVAITPGRKKIRMHSGSESEIACSNFGL
jgi:hypothetical protein